MTLSITFAETCLLTRLSGGLAGTLSTGHVLDDIDKADDERWASSLHLSIMDVPMERFGDSGVRLAGI